MRGWVYWPLALIVVLAIVVAAVWMMEHLLGMSGAPMMLLGILLGVVLGQLMLLGWTVVER